MHICVYRVLNLRIYIQVMYIGEFVFVNVQVQAQQLTTTYTHIYVYIYVAINDKQPVRLLMYACLFVYTYLHVRVYKRVYISTCNFVIYSNMYVSMYGGTPVCTQVNVIIFLFLQMYVHVCI